MPASTSNRTRDWHGRTVLITGVCGTVGSELLRQLLNADVLDLVGVDNNESELFFLQEAHRGDRRVQFYVGDVRDRDTMIDRMTGVDVVLHTAALKHVILCEQSPRDAVSTNIHGVQNIIDAALVCRPERVLFTSSDKAVNPTNVMGTSKLMGERLMTAANAQRRGDRPILASTRFGNVLGSRGSVIPLFARQIAAGGPLTLTDSRMTRFIMTLPEAVALVLDSVFLAHGGEAFVTKMPVVRIADLAQVMIEELAPRYGRDPQSIQITDIGPRPGEKLFEELMNEEETRRAVELDRYFAVLPTLKPVHSASSYVYEGMQTVDHSRPYNSSLEEPMPIEELRSYLREHAVLEEASG